jgi:hypothetical protein
MESIKNKISDGLNWKNILVRLLVGGVIAFVLYVAGIIYNLTATTRLNYEMGPLKTAKIVRSKSACKQTQTLIANVNLDRKSVICICGFAAGKLQDASCPKIGEGMVDIRIFVREIEIAQNSVSNCSRFRLEDRQISSTVTAFIEKERGSYSIKVVAVYFGNIELHNTVAKYMVLPQKDSGILRELTEQ